MEKAETSEFWPLDAQIALEIGAHEALVRQTYYDSKKVPTWCVGITSASGHKVDRYWRNPAPLEKCLGVFAWCLEKYAKDVRETFAGHPLTKEQFTGALSFHWNTGAIKTASWPKSFKAGKIAQASKQFMQWNKPKEIIGRRQKEHDLFFNGKWSGDGKITEYTRVKPNGYIDWSKTRRIDIIHAMNAALASS